jgi:hypothetical protein
MLSPGDLIFLRTGNPAYTDQRGFGHVGIYEGGGKVISATGHARGVAEDPLSSWGSWEGRRYPGVGRPSLNISGGTLAGLRSAVAGLAPLSLYDSGGYLPPGVSIAINKTGGPERVLGPGQAGNTINNNYTLVIHSSAPVEPIRHDFAMLRSMNARSS